MDSIKNMKSDVSDVVAQAVTITFDTMFRMGVARGGDDAKAGAETRRGICSCVTLTQGGTLDVDVRFRFDPKLLSGIAQENYPDESLDESALREDLACAIANIVGSRVKTFLNGKGFDLTMNLPFIRANNDDQPQPNAEIAAETSQLSFQIGAPDGGAKGEGIGMLVDIEMRQPRG
jgi:hypothetical protein